MRISIAFDVYGTLINPAGIVEQLRIYLGDGASTFSDKWRSTQINYSFRRSMMDEFAPFTQCTRDALDATCLHLGIKLSETQKSDLMQKYLELPPFKDVAEILNALDQKGYDLYAFSNGTNADLDALFNFAGIRACFKDLISVTSTRKFKPDPTVYAHLQNSVGTKKDQLVFVSANAFDVQGARNAGLFVVWLNRQAKLFDPWGPQPSFEVANLKELVTMRLDHSTL